MLATGVGDSREASQAIAGDVRDASFAPKAGLYKSDLALTWSHRIDEHWGLTLVGGVSRLLGDTGDSPLACRKTLPQGGALLSYTF